jgi:LacI family transcriptional regulator
VSATLADIAKATGTSISTVSRVLTGAAAAKRISPQTREKITVAAKQLGYRPNLLARSLRTRKTHTVAVMVSDIANPWFGQLASLIEQSLHRKGYSLVVCNSWENAELEQEYLRLLPQKGIDGLIIVPLSTKKEQLERYLPEEMPIVVLDRPVAGIPASITSDQEQAVRLLCDKLAMIGVSSVALVSGPRHVFTHRVRSEAVQQRFKVMIDHEGPAQRETGRLAWTQEIAGSRADAVVCTNNFLAQGVLEAMSAGNWMPPVAMFDGIPAMDLLPVPIVSCFQDVHALADGAVDMLLTQLDAPGTVKPIVVPMQVTWNKAFDKVLLSR